MMKTALKLLSPLLVALVVFAGEARACSCAGTSPPCEAYWQASAVFVGQVVGVSTVELEEGEGEDRRKYTWYAYRFAVERPLRGVQDAHVEVLTGGGGGDCGYEFKRGGRYIVYAHLDEKKERLFTGICTRTSPAADAGEDLRYVDGLSKGPPSGGTIYGEVSKERLEKDDEGNERRASAPVAGAKLEAAGGGRTFRAETDAKGKYRFRGLPPGEYALKIDVPETLLVNSPARKVTVGERGCAVEVFYAETNGRLSGRVFDSTGRPRAKVLLRLSAAEHGEEYFRGPVGHATTDAEGRYKFEGLSAGRYIIRIRSDGEETEAGRPFPLLYHENVSDAARARVVEVGEEARVEDYDIHLPPLPAEREVEGVVVWADGQPAAGVHVSYTADIPHLPVSYGVKTDGAGRFSFKSYEGIALRLSVSVGGAEGRVAHTAVVAVPAAGPVGPLRIVVPRP